MRSDLSHTALCRDGRYFVPSRIDGASASPLELRSFPMNCRIVETRCRPSISSQLPNKYGRDRNTEQQRLDQSRLLSDSPTKEPLELRIDDDLAILVHADDLPD